MKQNDKLFELIKSLEPQEKLWILKCLKAFQQQHNLTLFKYLDKQQEYDKERLLSDLQKAPFTKYLFVQKNNLYHSILDFMRLHSKEMEKGAHYELWGELVDLTFLQEKGLNGHCLDRLEKAQKTAEQDQQYYQLLKFLSMERDILSSGAYENATLEKLKSIHQDYLYQLEQLKTIWTYRFWGSKISILKRNPILFTPAEQEQSLRNIKEFMQKDEAPTNPAALYYHYQTNLLYHLYITKDFSQAFQHIEQQVKYLETIHINTKNATKNKVAIFVNSITVAFFANIENEKVNSLIDKTFGLLQDKAYVSLQAMFYGELFCNALKHYNYSLQLEKGDKMVQNIIEKQSQNSFLMTQNLHLALAVHYFLKEDYVQAVAINNEILNSSSKKILATVYYNAIVLELLIHIELDNLLYITSIIQRLKRFLIQKEIYTPFNYTVCQFFKQLETELLAATPNPSNLCKDYCKKLQEQTSEMRQQLPFINLIAWLDRLKKAKGFENG